MAKSLSRFHHILVHCKSGFSFNFADGSSKCEFSSGLGKQFRDFCTDYRMKSMHLEIFLQDGLFTDRVLLWSYYQPNRQEPSWTTGGKASSIPILLLLLLNYHPTQLIGISSSRFFGQNLCYQGKCWASECFLPSITFLWTPKSTFMLLSVQYTVRRHWTKELKKTKVEVISPFNISLLQCLCKHPRLCLSRMGDSDCSPC